MKYREVQGVPSELRLGFVDLDFQCSTVCPTLLGVMGIWQKRLGSWTRWWNTEIKVNPAQGSAHLGHPVKWYNQKQPCVLRGQFGWVRKRHCFETANLTDAVLPCVSHPISNKLRDAGGLL